MDDAGVEQSDVVVVGSGTAGLTASVVAAHSGLRVLAVEKAPYLGGVSAWSGGGCWVPANPLAAGRGWRPDRRTFARVAGL